MPSDLYFLSAIPPETPKVEGELPPWGKVQVIGKRLPRIDAFERVSGKAVYPEHRYQTAAYREAARFGPQSHGINVSTCRRGVLHIPQDADGPARFHEHTRHQADFQGFLSCLYLYHDLKRGI